MKSFFCSGDTGSVFEKVTELWPNGSKGKTIIRKEVGEKIEKFIELGITKKGKNISGIKNLTNIIVWYKIFKTLQNGKFFLKT